MPTSYPGGLDAFRTDYDGLETADDVDHAGMHNDANAAVLAVQAELGTNPSGAADTVAQRLSTIEADPRWTDQRTPTGHAASHRTGGADALSPADIGAATAAQGSKADTALQPFALAKGDLLVGTGSGTSTREPVGGDGQLLIADSSRSDGLGWATLLPVRQNVAAGSYIVPGEKFGTITAPTAFRYHASPLILGQRVTVDALSVEVTAASNTRTIALLLFRLGTTGWSPVAGSGTGNLTVVTGALTGVLAAPVTLPPGIYAAGMNTVGTQAGVTYRAVTANTLVGGLTVRVAFDAATARGAGLSASQPSFSGAFVEERTVPAVGMRIAA